MAAEVIIYRRDGRPTPPGTKTWDPSNLNNPLKHALDCIERKSNAFFGAPSTLRSARATRLTRYKVPQERKVWVTGLHGVRKDLHRGLTASFTVRFDWDEQKGSHVHMSLSLEGPEDKLLYNYVFSRNSWTDTRAMRGAQQRGTAKPPNWKATCWGCMEMATRAAGFDKTQRDANGSGSNEYCRRCAQRLLRAWAELVC